MKIEKRDSMVRWVNVLLVCLFCSGTWAKSPLEPVRTDSPRDTMMSFLTAMNDYRKGVAEDRPDLQRRIDDAVRTLNLKDIPTLTRREFGRTAAIQLKEVIDRVIIVDPEKIPSTTDIERWRLKDTEIVISKTDDEDRKGEFLFTPSTVDRAEDFYQRVKELPYLKGSGQGALYKQDWDESIFPVWSQKQIFGIQVWQIVGLFISILIGFIIKTISEWIIQLIKSLLTENEKSVRYLTIVALEKPVGLVVASLFWAFSVFYLRFEGQALSVLTGAIQVLLGASVIWAVYRFVDVFSLTLKRWASRTESDLDDQLVPMITKSLRIFIVIFGVLIIVQNLGFNVMSLLAGLGIGGLALALAAKDTAANLFGSIMILIDQPFRVGDWIKSADVEGTVEQIGFRSTRVRTFYNSLISIPNSTLATANIDNMGLRRYRRTRTVLGITYDTPPEKMEAFVEGVKNILYANPKTPKDLINVAFDSYGDCSLNILLNFFLEVPNWTEELIEKQNIYIEILRLASELGIDFAFPTRTLHMETFPEKQPAVVRHQDWSESKIKSAAAAFAKDGRLAKPKGLGIYTGNKFHSLNDPTLGDEGSS